MGTESFLASKWEGNPSAAWRRRILSTTIKNLETGTETFFAASCRCTLLKSIGVARGASTLQKRSTPTARVRSQPPKKVSVPIAWVGSVASGGRKNVSVPIYWCGEGYGVGTAGLGTPSAAALVNEADRALYQSKQFGRN
jgi:hypothetical protein